MFSALPWLNVREGYTTSIHTHTHPYLPPPQVLPCLRPTSITHFMPPSLYCNTSWCSNPYNNNNNDFFEDKQLYLLRLQYYYLEYDDYYDDNDDDNDFTTIKWGFFQLFCSCIHDMIWGSRLYFNFSILILNYFLCKKELLLLYLAKVAIN